MHGEQYSSAASEKKAEPREISNEDGKLDLAASSFESEGVTILVGLNSAIVCAAAFRDIAPLMASVRRQYPFHLIEPKWQRHWEQQQTFRAWNPGESIPENHPFAQRHASQKPESVEKFYILDMFPYPSGAGLHVGHPEGYTATDILARYKRARGLHVLHPMGWDAFGFPAEQYAIKTGQHPHQTTNENIGTFKRQI